MKYANRYVENAIQLLQAYDGTVPLAIFLKKYFAQYKKFGSKDRKNIAQLCYAYFRVGSAAKNIQKEEGIKIALFITNNEPGKWGELFDENWLTNWTGTILQRLAYVESIQPLFDRQQIFPFDKVLSAEVDSTLFSHGHLIQPDLFLRVRSNKLNKVKASLTNAGIQYHQLTDTTLALPNSTKLNEVIALDTDAVVQDLSSQKVGALIQKIDRKLLSSPSSFSVWDCCAASGGKSILAHDILGSFKLVVSDIRSAILHNLSQRFERAGLRHYQQFVVDLSNIHLQKNNNIHLPKADLLIADVPCSGSGTWSRTPEQLFYFNQQQIAVFQDLQQKIISNIIPSLNKGGYLLFITCSVFKQENEENSAFIQHKFSLQLLEQGIIKGYENKADTMFAALFRRI